MTRADLVTSPICCVFLSYSTSSFNQLCKTTLHILLLNVNHGSKSLSNTAVYHSLILLYINALLLLNYRGSINNVEARQDVVLDLIVLHIMKLTSTL